MLAFACSNRASGSTHRSSQSNTNAVLIPSKFNAFPQHPLFGGFLSSPLSSFIQVSEETILFLSLRCEDTHTREHREQAKQRRTSSSLSLFSATSITDESRVHRVKTQPNRPSFSYPSKVHFLSEPIGRTVSFSLSLTLSVPSISLFLCIEVFSKDELQLSHQSVMGGQPVSRRGREKFLFFNSQQPHHRKMSFGFPRPSWNRPFRIEFVFLRLHSLVFVKLQSHGAKLARAKPRFKL